MSEGATLVSEETYELYAVHIGTQQKSADMKQFISHVRSDGLYLLDLGITDGRIRSIATFLNRYDAQRAQPASLQRRLAPSVLLDDLFQAV